VFKFIIKAISFVTLSLVFGLLIAIWFVGIPTSDTARDCTVVCRSCQSCVDTQYDGVFPFIEVLPAYPEEQL